MTLGGVSRTRSRRTSAISIEPLAVVVKRGRRRCAENFATSCSVLPAPTLQSSVAFVQGQEIRQFALHHPQAVPRQLEIADDLRVQQRDRVGRNGIAEARMKFLGDGGAADDAALLEHGDLQTGGREICGANQTVMAAADDDDISCAESATRLSHGAADCQPGAGARSSRLSGISSACAARNCAAKLHCGPAGPGCSCASPCPTARARSAPCPRG